MKKLLSIILSAVMLLSLFSACGSKPVTSAPPAQSPQASAQPSGAPKDLVYNGPKMELTVNFSSAEPVAKIYTDTLKRITERTGGKVTFVNYFSNSLLSPAEALKGVGTGVCDISDVTMANFPEQFVYSQQVMSYPFLGFTSIAMASDIMNKNIYNNKLMMDEFKAAKVYPLFFLGVWGTAMVLKNDVKITTPDSVKGLKLITDNRILSKFLADKGATPVAQPPTEFFSSMSNGVVDGVINGLHVVNIFGALSIAKTVYMFERSFSTGCRAICINDAKWNSFDSTLKQIFTEEMLGDQLITEGAAYWKVSDQSHLDDAKKWNIPVNYIKGADMEAWADALKPYGDETLKQLKDKGYKEVDSVLEFWKKSISEYNGKYK